MKIKNFKDITVIFSSFLAIVMAVSLSAGTVIDWGENKVYSLIDPAVAATVTETDISESGYLYEWDPSSTLKELIKPLGGGVLGDDALFNYENNYWGHTGVLSTSYSESGESVLYGNKDTGQSWKSFLTIPSDTSYDGFHLSSASQHYKGVVFKAPVSGSYKFFPKSLGLDYQGYSIYSSSNWTVKIYTETSTLAEYSYTGGTASNFSEFTFSLNKGEAFYVLFSAPGYKDQGHRINFNFGLALTDETEMSSNVLLEEAVYESTEYRPSTHIDVVKANSFTSDYDISPFSVVSGNDADAITSWTNSLYKNMDGETVFINSSFVNSDDFSNAVTVDGDNIRICAEGDYLSAIVFTAPFNGEYTFLADSVTFDPAEGSSLSFLDNDGTLISTVTNSLNYSKEMTKGEKIYLLFEVSQTGSDTSSCSIENFRVTGFELVSDAVYGDGYIYTKDLSDYIYGADFAYSANDHLSINIGKSDKYEFEVLIDVNGEFVPLEESDNGTFVMLNPTGSYAYVCIRGYENGVLSAERYITYVYRTGGVYDFCISGRSVHKEAYGELVYRGFSLGAEGSNVYYKLENGEKIKLDGNVRINVPASGKYKLTVYFEDYSKEIIVTAYDADESTFAEFNAAYIEYSDGKVFLTSDSKGSSYSYYIKTYNGDTVSNVIESDLSFCKMPLSLYGIYNAQIGFKNNGTSYDTAFYNKQIVIERPDGKWSIESSVAGSKLDTVVVTSGVSFDISASALFGGNQLGSTKYALYQKVGDKYITIEDYSNSSDFTFMPEGSGVYELVIAVRAANSGSAEAVKEITVIVDDDRYDGKVEVTGYDFNGIGKTARVEAVADDYHYGELYYRFYAVYPDSTVLIKDYSVDNYVEFIPTRKEHFDVRVEVKSSNCEGSYDVFCEYNYSHNCEASNPTAVYAADCEESGIDVVYCTVCGEIISATETEPAGHVFGDWHIISEPTLEEFGIMERYCLKDETHVDTENIDKLVIKEAKVLSYPHKMSYSSGEVFDPTGFSLQVSYTTIERVDVFNEFDRLDFDCAFTKIGQNEIVLDFYGTDIKFYVTVEKTIELGDVDDDEEITNSDVDLIVSYVLGDITSISSNADVNSDGNINLQDALLIKQYLAGYNVKYFK